MKTFDGGSAVDSGYYLNVRTWEIVPVSQEDGVLAGSKSDRYRRVSTPLVFLLAPLFGALFVVFMPIIGFVLTWHALVRRRVEAPVLAPEVGPSRG